MTGKTIGEVDHLILFPATHFVTNDEHMEQSIAKIQAELEEQLKVLKLKANYWKRSDYAKELSMTLKC